MYQTESRKKLVVDHSDIKFTRTAFLVSGILSAISGIFLTVTNPQITSAQRDSVIYANGTLSNQVTLEPDRTSVNIGLALSALGLVGVSMSLRISKHIAFESVSEIEQNSEKANESLVKQVSKVANNFSKLSKVQQQSLLEPIHQMILEHKWLLNAVNAHSLVIVGGSGSGKSRLAMAIALLNALVRQGTINIADLDAQQNLATNCWTAGNIFGTYEKEKDSQVFSTEEGKEKEVLYAINEASKPRTKDDRFLVTLYDEISKWSNGKYTELESSIMEIITSGSQEARKRNMQNIYIIHGLPSGMWGIDSSNENVSGKLNNLYRTSCVLYLQESDPPETITLDSFGQGQRAEFLFWKKSGDPLASNATPPKLNDPTTRQTWKVFNLPKNLDPLPLSEFLAPFINALGLKPQIPTVIQDSSSQFKKELQSLEKQSQGIYDMVDTVYRNALSVDGFKLFQAMKDNKINPLILQKICVITEVLENYTEDQILALAKKEKSIQLSEDKKEIRFSV
jgi:energy-coupling factor transporter ATP-binding protein EcfA2